MKQPKSKVKYSRASLTKLRKAPKLRADLLRRANAVATQASENGRVSGYKVTDLVLEEPRAAVSVMATGHARNHNAKTMALLKSLDAGRR
jgi:hypothetical protein